MVANRKIVEGDNGTMPKSRETKKKLSNKAFTGSMSTLGRLVKAGQQVVILPCYDTIKEDEDNNVANKTPNEMNDDINPENLTVRGTPRIRQVYRKKAELPHPELPANAPENVDLKNVTTRLPSDLINQVKSEAKRQNTTREVFIRTVLESYFDDSEPS